MKVRAISNVAIFAAVIEAYTADLFAEAFGESLPIADMKAVIVRKISRGVSKSDK